jgi:cell division septal protein FtsQ
VGSGSAGTRTHVSTAARAKALRRRTKPSIAVRVRTFWVVAVLAVCIVLAAGFGFANAPQLRVRAIDANVPSGGPVTKNAVVAAAHIDPDANLWLLNTGAIRRRLETIPYVATAVVHRAQFPRPAVTLDVALRTPTGCVQSSTGTVTIDATARVLQTDCVSATLPLVDVGAGPAVAPGAILTAPDVDRLLADARSIGEHIPVRVVRRDRWGGLEAVDSRGVLLKFGSDKDLPAKLALVEPIRRSAGLGRPLRAIDLRAPTTPVVEFP